MSQVPQSHAYRGTGLESVLDLAHDLYAKRGLAGIRHYGVTGRWRGGRNGSHFEALPKVLQPVDYHGSVAGRLVVFDAKQTINVGHWQLDARFAHQHERLTWWAAFDAVAWFAVESLALETLYLLRIFQDSPWPELTFPPVPAYRILTVPRNGEGWYDWLPVVQSAYWLA